MASLRHNARLYGPESHGEPMDEFVFLGYIIVGLLICIILSPIAIFGHWLYYKMKLDVP